MCLDGIKPANYGLEAIINLDWGQIALATQ